MSDAAPPAYYVTTPDRIGLAVLVGGMLTGLVAMPLIVAGGARSVAAIVLAWTIGAILSMIGIVAAAGPPWLALHRDGRRGPGAAASTTGLIALAIVTAGQVWGSGGDAYRWASAIATAVPVALAAAAIGAVMQRVAYRRLL